MRKSLKICFVIDSLQIGGANRLTLKIIELLLLRGHNIKLIILYRIEPECNKDIFKDLDIELIYLNFDKINFFKRILYLLRTIQGYPIIHTCLENSNLYSSIARLFVKRSVKFISTFHGVDGVYIEEKHLKDVVAKEWPRKYVFMITTIQNILFKYYDGFIVLCNDTKKFLMQKRKIDENMISVIYHGSDINEMDLNVSEGELNDLRNKYNLKNDHFVLAYVGRITYAKGLMELILAFKKIILYYPETRLLLIGDGDLADELRIRIRDLDLTEYVTITGFYENALRFYKIMNVFLLTSYSESLSLVTQEAMFNKVICLCSDCGGLAEVINNNEDGFLFRTGDFEEFETKLINIIQNFEKYEYIRSNAKNKIIRKFDINKNILLIEKYFLDLNIECGK